MPSKMIKIAPVLIILLTLFMYAAQFVPALSIRALIGALCALPVIGLSIYILRAQRGADSASQEYSATPVQTPQEPTQEGLAQKEQGQENPTQEDATQGSLETSPASEGQESSQLHYKAHKHVNEALSGMAQVVPILNEQLKAVIDYTEDAAMQLSQSFISINRKAKEQVQDVHKIFGSMSDDESSETQNVLVNIRSNLNALTEGLDTLVEQIKKNSDSINSVLRQTKSIEEIVATTSEITENSRVLSINATIEAARAGEHGRGFAVVASEFKQMTEESEEATREIEETVQKISDLISAVHKEIQESKDISQRLGEQTKNQGQESVDKIDSVIDEARSDLDKLSQQAEAFAKDINSIIVSIQFQDITRQRIEHVIEPLQEFATDLEKIGSYIEHIEQADSIQQLSNFDSAVDRLRQKYTMEAEKELMEKSMLNQTAAQKGEE